MGYFAHRTGRFMLLLAVLCFSLTGWGMQASAQSEPEAYNYSSRGDALASPQAYKATMLLTGAGLGAGHFKSPSDIHAAANHLIYIADSGNNRIVVLNEELKLQRIIDSFVNNGQTDHFENPQGIYVTDQGHVYVSDTGKSRIVHLDPDNRLVKVIQAPRSDLLNGNFRFQPTRLVVDQALRVYVMSIGVFDGFMEFNADGEFTSFFGANRVTVDPVEYFWKRLSTKKQRSQMVMFTPTEFTSLDMNSEGFIYSTNADAAGDNIKMLNAQGNDILRRGGYQDPQGDVRFFTKDGRSRLVDVDVGDHEIYSVLDSKQGRIFTYNGDGYLMYIFGGLGNQVGQFQTPVAIERAGGRFLVLDKGLGEVTVFASTEYGRVLNEAAASYYRGDEENAYLLYKKAVNMNTNLEYVYSGIGKALLRQGEYSQAMQYFKQSMDQTNYSKAFLLYRKALLREHFSSIMTVILVLAALTVTGNKVRKSLMRRKVVAN